MKLLSIDTVIVPSLRLLKRLRGGRLMLLAFGLGKVHLLPPIFVIRIIIGHYGGELVMLLGL